MSTIIDWLYAEDKKTKSGARIRHGQWFDQTVHGMEEVIQILKAVPFLPENMKKISKEEKAWSEAKLHEYPSLFDPAENKT